MPAFVTPRRGPESRGQSLVNVSAQYDATHPGETPDPGEAWPLPKLLRVRLQTSAERFGKETALDERLRLAERLQVRAHRRTRVACLPRVCFSTERRFAFRARAPGRARETRRARTPRPRASARGDFDAERVPALRAPRLPSHARGVRARGPSETKSRRLFQESPSNEKSTTTLNRERFRVSCYDAMHGQTYKKKQKSTRRRRRGRFARDARLTHSLPTRV